MDNGWSLYICTVESSHGPLHTLGEQPWTMGLLFISALGKAPIVFSTSLGELPWSFPLPWESNHGLWVFSLHLLHFLWIATRTMGLLLTSALGKAPMVFSTSLEEQPRTMGLLLTSALGKASMVLSTSLGEHPWTMGLLLTSALWKAPMVPSTSLGEQPRTMSLLISSALGKPPMVLSISWERNHVLWVLS